MVAIFVVSLVMLLPPTRVAFKAPVPHIHDALGKLFIPWGISYLIFLPCMYMQITGDERTDFVYVVTSMVTALMTISVTSWAYMAYLQQGVRQKILQLRIHNLRRVRRSERCLTEHLSQHIRLRGTSNSKMFDNNLNTLYNWNKLPTEETCIQLKNADFLDYLRILPHQCKYPVFAEIKLIDFNNKEIPHYKFKLYSIGEGLTGDTAVVKSLTDNNEMTTFYKQFPFWIGIDIKKCKNEISALKLILWNDVNRILKNHTYELFYYNNGWESLDKKKATAGYLNYNNVPVGCLFLLRDYTAGKEERIFEYKDGKQIWW